MKHIDWNQIKADYIKCS